MLSPRCKRRDGGTPTSRLQRDMDSFSFRLSFIFLQISTESLYFSLMSSSRKTTPDEVYFVTLTIMGWVDLFSRDSYRRIVVENLQYCQKKESLEIFAYVIMSNHLHMIVRRNGGDLNELLGRFKSYTAKKVIAEIERSPKESRQTWLLSQFKHFASKGEQYSNYHVWHYENYPTLLYSYEVFMQKRQYIHMNPVRAGIVTDPSHYLYSSASPDSPLKVNEF